MAERRRAKAAAKAAAREAKIRRRFEEDAKQRGAWAKARAAKTADGELVAAAGSPTAQAALKASLSDAGAAWKQAGRPAGRRPWLRMLCCVAGAAGAAAEDAAAGEPWRRAAAAWGRVRRARAATPDAAAGVPSGVYDPLPVDDAGGGFEAACADLLRRTTARAGWSMAAVALDAYGQPLGDRRLIAVGSAAGRMTRQPALANLAMLQPLEAYVVDGEPVATDAPNARRTLYRPRLKRGSQRSLFPETMGGCRVHDAIVRAAVEFGTFDHRSPVLGDLLLTAHLAFALTGNGLIPAAAGSEFLSDANTEGGRRRWNVATRNLRAITITIDPKTERWVQLADITPDPRSDAVWLSAPYWWRERTLTRGAWGAYRPSGLLWRRFPRLDAKKQTTEIVALYAGLARMLAGWEARLAWTKPVGGGRGGRIAEALIPVRKGGPGQEVFVSWRESLIGAGEYVDPGETTMGTPGRRWRRRLEYLIDAPKKTDGTRRTGEHSYLVKADGLAAAAGDTVEITKVVTGSKSQEPGVRIRATARFCEAASGKARVEYVPASHLFGGAADR